MGYVLFVIWIIIGFRIIYERHTIPIRKLVERTDRVGCIYKIKVKDPTISKNADLNMLLRLMIKKNEYENERIVRIDEYVEKDGLEYYELTEADGFTNSVGHKLITEFTEVTGTELEQFKTKLLLISIK